MFGRQKTYPRKFKENFRTGTVLSKKFEEKLVNWILYKADRGQPVSTTELLDSIQYYVKVKGIKTQTSYMACKMHSYINKQKFVDTHLTGVFINNYYYFVQIGIHTKVLIYIKYRFKKLFTSNFNNNYFETIQQYE